MWKIVLGESASALASFTSARFSLSKSDARDRRLCNSSVQSIDSREAVGTEVSAGRSFFASVTVPLPHAFKSHRLTRWPSTPIVEAFIGQLSSFSTVALLRGYQ